MSVVVGQSQRGTHPDVSPAALSHGCDAVTGQAIGLGKGAPFSALQAAYPSIQSAKPEGAILELADGRDISASQPIGGDQSQPLLIVAAEATTGANPHNPLLILKDGRYLVMGQPVGCGVGFPFAIVAAQALHGAKPQGAILSLKDSSHCVGGQPIGGGEGTPWRAPALSCGHSGAASQEAKEQRRQAKALSQQIVFLAEHVVTPYFCRLFSTCLKIPFLRLLLPQSGE